MAIPYRENSIIVQIVKAKQVLLADGQSYSTVIAGRRGSEAGGIGVITSVLCLEERDDVEGVSRCVASYIPMFNRRRLYGSLSVKRSYS